VGGFSHNFCVSVVSKNSFTLKRASGMAGAQVSFVIGPSIFT
jgi:hypothetical protein